MPINMTPVRKEALQLAGDEPLVRYGRSSWVHKPTGRRFPNFWTIERMVRYGVLKMNAYGTRRWLTPA